MSDYDLQSMIDRINGIEAFTIPSLKNEKDLFKFKRVIDEFCKASGKKVIITRSDDGTFLEITGKQIYLASRSPGKYRVELVSGGCHIILGTKKIKVVRYPEGSGTKEGGYFSTKPGVALYRFLSQGFIPKISDIPNEDLVEPSQVIEKVVIKDTGEIAWKTKEKEFA